MSQSGGSLEPRLGSEARSGGRFDVRAEGEGRHNNNITHDELLLAFNEVCGMRHDTKFKVSAALIYQY